MSITAEQVAKLRERTGAGMMDCKRALTENSGDFDKAIEYLRKKGMASASKKAGRTAKEGTVFSLVDTAKRVAVLVEVNCETDFVAKTENFQKFVNQIATHIIAANPESPQALLTQKYSGDTSKTDAQKTVDEFIRETISVLGENIMVRRFARYAMNPGIAVHSYIHAGGKVGVLVEASITNAAKATDAALTGLLRDLTMHVAAASPLYLKSDEVPQDIIAKEKEIALAQLQTQNKPADVLEKIASGKISKYFEDVCFLKQKFIKDDKKTVEALVAETGKAMGETIAITRFARFLLGDGVEVVVEVVAEQQH